MLNVPHDGDESSDSGQTSVDDANLHAHRVDFGELFGGRVNDGRFNAV